MTFLEHQAIANVSEMNECLFLLLNFLVVGLISPRGLMSGSSIIYIMLSSSPIKILYASIICICARTHFEKGEISP